MNPKSMQMFSQEMGAREEYRQEEGTRSHGDAIEVNILGLIMVAGGRQPAKDFSRSW